MRSLASLLTAAALVVTAVGGLPARGDDRSRPLAAPVIAVVDDGIDPYHADFAAPGRRQSPATYLPGYPATARALDLHLHERSFTAARAKDAKVWSSLKPNRMYWVPGTKIAGLILIPPTPLDAVNQQHISPGARYPVLDGSDHGTEVASVAAGNIHGACRECLIVVVDAEDTTDAVQWAARQSWIDVITNSYGGPFGVPVGGSVAGHPTTGAINDATRQAVAAGKLVVFASGNGVTDTGNYTGVSPDHGLTWDSPYTGPPWILTVGAADPHSKQPTSWYDVPVDVVSYGTQWPAAAPNTIRGQTDFGGTSCAAPIAAGVAARALGLLRAKLRSSRHRADGDLIRTARPWPTHGPLADGQLTSLELMAALKAAARYVAFDPRDPSALIGTTPTTSWAYAYEGWGLVDPSSVPRLVSLLVGQRVATPSPALSQWDERQHAARTSLWGRTP